ncbi:hypothetical protein H4W80_004404 [Nonomuraea angiospora]|uniref:Uncharacterized protein n=1 Tax=Nonomuraea angiospora TaxID=46172 RepID=A0ABR9LZR2_9ACTN|nr:hypothetical protein [Nonomuraea angiospora]
MGFSRRYRWFRSETSEAMRIRRRVLHGQAGLRSLGLNWVHHGDKGIHRGRMRSQRIHHHQVSLDLKGPLCLRTSIEYLHSAEDVR